MERLVTGVYWRYNVHQNGVPVKEFGKVVYVVDNFGNAVIIHDRKTLNHSLN